MRGVLQRMIDEYFDWRPRLAGEIEPDEASRALELLRGGKPLPGDLASRLIVKTPWVLEAERQVEEKLATARNGVEYTIIVGGYRAGKSQLMEYLAWIMGRRPDVLVVKHDFGARPRVWGFLQSLGEALANVTTAGAEGGITDVAALASNLRELSKREIPDADARQAALRALKLLVDRFAVVSLHFDEFEKLRGEDVYPWIDLLTTMHDGIDRGLYSLLYLTGDDLRRLQTDRRMERLASFIREKVHLSGVYRDSLPEAFGKIASLATISEGAEIGDREVLTIAELVACAYERLSERATVGEANSCLVDMVHSMVRVFEKVNVSEYFGLLSKVSSLLGGGRWTADVGSRFEGFVKESLAKRVHSEFRIDDDHYLVEYVPEPIRCGKGKKESDGYLLVRVKRMEHYEDFAKIPVEIKVMKSVSQITRDWRSLAPCGLLGIFTVEDPEQTPDLIGEVAQKVRKKSGDMPLAILAYPRSFAVIAALQKEEAVADLLERAFLATWDYDLVVYNVAVSLKAKSTVELIPSPPKPATPEELISIAVIETMETVKSRKQRNVLVKAVKTYLNKSGVNLSEDNLALLLNGVIDRLRGAGLIRVGTTRRKGVQEITYVKTDSWTRERAIEVLGIKG